MPTRWLHKNVTIDLKQQSQRGPQNITHPPPPPHLPYGPVVYWFWVTCVNWLGTVVVIYRSAVPPMRLIWTWPSYIIIVVAFIILYWVTGWWWLVECSRKWEAGCMPSGWVQLGGRVFDSGCLEELVKCHACWPTCNLYFTLASTTGKPSDQSTHSQKPPACILY